MSETVEIPLSLLKKMTEAGEAFRSLEEEMEDFFISKNRPLLARLQRAREQHRSGKVRPFSEIRRAR